MAHAQLATRNPATSKSSPTVLPVLIDKWRLQRIEVRRLLVQLLSDEPQRFADSYSAINSELEKTQAVRSLCTELIDYVSTGHFEIYGRVLPRKLRPDPELHTLLQHLFHSIGCSTDAVLGFNDRYEQAPTGALTKAFRQLLVRLSRRLLLRFALEEQLLELCSHPRRWT